MKWFTLGICGVLTLSLVGCGVSKDKYMQLEKEKQQLEERTTRLMHEKESLADNLDEIKRLNEGKHHRIIALEEELKNLRARTDSLKQSQPTNQPSQGSLDAGYK